MTLIALPTGFCPNSFALSQQTNQRVSSSNFGGSEQVVDLLNDRWQISLSMPNRKHADAARVEAFIAALRGSTNTVALWHYLRPKPRGSMRGAPVLKFPLFRADPNLIVQTDPGATLLAGDMVGCGGLLFQVASDCVAGGTGELYIPIVNRSRLAAPAGSAVVWDKPTAPFRQVSRSAVQYIPGYAPEVAFDFVEAVT